MKTKVQKPTSTSPVQCPHCDRVHSVLYGNYGTVICGCGTTFCIISTMGGSFPLLMPPRILGDVESNRIQKPFARAGRININRKRI